MTFYIPPVFLFGNNANRLHNNEEEKSEYKTAAETEINIENWRAKRIAELEEENRKLKEERDNFMLKYSKAIEEKVVETNKLCTERNKLEEENKKLKKILNRIKELYEDEDEAGLLNYLDEILDEI